MLLFDEADSLFAKRTEVKTSNDRYGNLAVNYLLQRLEQYTGVVVMTTNKEASLDEALWCLTRREAIGDERLSWDEVKATFTARAGGKENGWSFFAEEIEESLE